MGFSDWLWGTNGGGDSSGSGSALDWAQFLAKFYQSQQGPKFYNTPQSPQQKDLYDWSTAQLKGLPNVSKALYPTAISNALTAPSFDVEAAKAGRTAYSHGTPPSAGDLANIIGQSGGGGTPPPGAGTPGGGGGVTTPSTGFGDPFVGGGAGGGTGQSVRPPGINSNADWTMFSNFVRQYGHAAGEGILALLTHNPVMGLRAAIDAWRAHQSGGGGPDSHGNYTGNPNPGGANWITPGDPGSGVTDLTPGANTNTPWDPHGPGSYYDPHAGAPTISGMLGQQMGGQGSWGRRQAF